MLLLPLGILAAVGLVILLRPWPFFIPTEESQGSNGEVSNRNIALAFAKWVERQARARGLNVRGFARDVPIECPKCHKTSNYFVYKPISKPIEGDRH